MAIKKFGAAAREAGPADSKLTPKPFTLPGEDYVYTATVPKESVWQRVQLAGRSNAPMDRRIEALVDFVRGTLANPQDAGRLEDRLLSGSDSLDLIDVFPVVAYLNGAWTAEAEGRLEQFNAEHGVIDEPPAALRAAADERLAEGVIDGELAETASA